MESMRLKVARDYALSRSEAAHAAAAYRRLPQDFRDIAARECRAWGELANKYQQLLEKYNGNTNN